MNEHLENRCMSLRDEALQNNCPFNGANETCGDCWHYNFDNYACDDGREHSPTDTACESWEDANEG